MDYKQVYFYESSGGEGDIGLKILASIGRELTEHDLSMFNLLSYNAIKAMRKETARLSPEGKLEKLQITEEIRNLFPHHIFMEEIPNEYCSESCCLNRPWFIVTSTIGHIKVGWRKRVFVIDWDKTIVAKTAEELFPDEQTTKQAKMIHAWGYDKARQYLEKLHGEHITAFEYADNLSRRGEK